MDSQVNKVRSQPGLENLFSARPGPQMTVEAEKDKVHWRRASALTQIAMLDKTIHLQQG